MTVYKAVKKEADAASELAIALAKGEKPTPAGPRSRTPQTGKDVPAVLLDPEAITKDNVKDVVADGYVTKADLCTGAFAAPCTAAGITLDPLVHAPRAPIAAPCRTRRRCGAGVAIAVRTVPTVPW